MNIVIGLDFHFCSRRGQVSFHWNISDGVIIGIGVVLSTHSV